MMVGAATAAPLTAAAQPSRVRRLGVLFVYGEDHPEVPSLVGALKDGLRNNGWIEAQNIQLEFRFCGSDAKLVKRYTDELVGLQPGRRPGGAAGGHYGRHHPADAAGHRRRSHRVSEACAAGLASPSEKGPGA